MDLYQFKTLFFMHSRDIHTDICMYLTFKNKNIFNILINSNIFDNMHIHT